MGNIWGKNKKYAKQRQIQQAFGTWLQDWKEMIVLWLPEDVEIKQEEQHLR